MQDEKSFLMGDFNGTLFAFCEMVKRMNKPLAFSKPFAPDQEEALRQYVQRNTESFGLQYFLEKNLLLTQLFASVNMDGRWVYIVYGSEENLQRYFHLKELWKDGLPEWERQQISWEYARLMGYREDASKALLQENMSYI